MFLSKFFKRKETSIACNPNPCFTIKNKGKINGVTKYYNGRHAQEVLEKLQVGDPLIFQINEAIPLSPSPECEPDLFNVKVTDRRKRQIGHFTLTDYEYQSLKENAQYGISAEVHISNLGRINGEMGDNIIWCEITYSFPSYYDPSEECAYITQSGRKYHLTEKCGNKQLMKVPMSYINRCHFTVCSTCLKKSLNSQNQMQSSSQDSAD